MSSKNINYVNKFSDTKIILLFGPTTNQLKQGNSRKLEKFQDRNRELKREGQVALISTFESESRTLTTINCLYLNQLNFLGLNLKLLFPFITYLS